MTSYSAIHRQIEMRTENILARKYLELLHLVNGEPGEEAEEAVKQNVVHIKQWHYRRPVSSKPSLETEAVENPSPEPPTMLSEENNRASTAGFRKWLRKKNAAQRVAKKQEKLVRAKEKLSEAEELKEQEERHKESQVAYSAWLNKKIGQISKIHEQKMSSGNDLHPSLSNGSTNKTAEELPSSVPDDNKSSESSGAVKSENIEICNDTLGEVSKPQPNKEAEKTGKPSTSEQNKQMPKPPPSSAEPVISKSSKKSSANNHNVTSAVGETSKHDKIANGAPENSTSEAQLKKHITFDEWLKLQKEKSVLQKATIKQEKEKLRSSLQNMTDAKISARKRVENILKDDDDKVSGANKSDNSQCQNVHPTSATTAPRNNRSSDETLRRSAAATHKWPRKSNEQREEKGHTANIAKEDVTKTKIPPCEPRQENTDTLKEDKSHGNVTASLDATTIDNKKEVFALTAVSESLG